MSKDPAFLFYPNDYLGGTMGMTFEEKGAYIELLMLQFNRGHMTKHMIGQTVGQLWDSLQSKFIVDTDGLYYNVRLEEEQNKRKLFTDSRKNNLKGENQYTKKRGHIKGHMTKHMENENEDVNVVRKFNHLSINKTEFQKLIDAGYCETEINGIFDRIENYKKNTSYKSLYLTSLNWLKEKYPDRKSKQEVQVTTAANYWDQLKPEYR